VFLISLHRLSEWVEKDTFLRTEMNTQRISATLHNLTIHLHQKIYVPTAIWKFTALNWTLTTTLKFYRILNARFTSTVDWVQFIYRVCFTLKREVSDDGPACIFRYKGRGVYNPIDPLQWDLSMTRPMSKYGASLSKCTQKLSRLYLRCGQWLDPRQADNRRLETTVYWDS
jgi:hypothetical protein